MSRTIKAAVERAAKQGDVSEAQVIRLAIAAAVSRPAPRSGLFASDKPFASRVDELLSGFGER